MGQEGPWPNLSAANSSGGRRRLSHWTHPSGVSLKRGLLVRTPRRLGRCARPRRCCGPPRREPLRWGAQEPRTRAPMMRPARA